MSDDLPIQFLTSHAFCLLYVARNPSLRLQDLADAVGISERYCLKVLSELEQAGYVSRVRQWRRTEYEVHGSGSLRLPGQPSVTVESMLAALQR